VLEIVGRKERVWQRKRERERKMERKTERERERREEDGVVYAFLY